MPKLTLRDLFWLVLVAAMGCAWWLDSRRWAYSHRKVREWEQRYSELEAVNAELEARRRIHWSPPPGFEKSLPNPNSN
jgi:hypothetical protein